MMMIGERSFSTASLILLDELADELMLQDKLLHSRTDYAT